jgi:hypothetical protein
MRSLAEVCAAIHGLAPDLAFNVLRAIGSIEGL